MQRATTQKNRAPHTFLLSSNPMLPSTLVNFPLMESARGWRFPLLLLFLLFHSSWSLNSSSVGPLSSTIRSQAFRALVHRRTSVAYQVPLPPDLSGISASVIRLRSRSFWDVGATIGIAHIPPGILPVPSVPRLLVVHQNLGNWSYLLDLNLLGYDLVPPVIGLLAYDASGVASNRTTELGFMVTGDPIALSFLQLASMEGLNSTGAKCARFDSRGSLHISDMALSNRCLTTSIGHFAVIVPSNSQGRLPPAVAAESEGMKWIPGVISGGLAVLILVGCLVGVVNCKLRRKRMEEMGRKADEGEALEIVSIGRSKMPSAGMVRTQPVIENGTAP